VIGRLLLAALAAALCCASPARAQSILFPHEQPAAVMHDALASSYGNALLDEFVKSVEKTAVIGCLTAKDLDAAKVKERGRELFQKWGTRTWEIRDAYIDRKKYESEMTALAGPSALQELERLRKAPDVQRYLTIERPARLARTIEDVIEQFDRYVLISRIGLNGVHPLGTGNEKLLSLNPTEAIEESLERFVKQRKSATLNRFLVLSDSARQARIKAIDVEAAKKWSPADFFRGVETDLGEICIGPRARKAPAGGNDL